VVEAVIAAGLPRLAERTITDPVRFRDALHDVRHHGYAVGDSELEDGLISASVPVRDADDEVLAALAYSSTAGRTTPERIVAEVVPLMKETAEAIRRDLVQLSGRPSPSSPSRDGFF
jgi:IclR family pca regulon transcriptional regulator